MVSDHTCIPNYHSRCSNDMRTRAGLVFGELIGIVQILFFSVIAFSYGSIVIKIRQTTKLIDVNAARYRNSAWMMSIFVAVFIFQWWPLVLVNIWSMVRLPPDALFVPTVVILNLGGVYNCLAYTVIRRRFKLTSGGGLTLSVK